VIKLKIMSQMYKYILFCLALFGPGLLSAQEFNCQVGVSAPTIQMTDKTIFKNMESQIREFMNTRHWTNDNFSSNERIDCSISIIIGSSNGPSGPNFSGTMQIVSSRPVYGTNYTTTLFNCLDKNFNVSYIQFQPFEYVENTYTNELTSILAYYAYIMLGYDYDSFSKYGGSLYFQKAQSIVNSAQSSGVMGWSSQEKDDHNRYYLANELTDDRFKPFREAVYTYHRLGMDIMAQDNSKGLGNVLNSLQEISDLRQTFTNAYTIKLFFLGKSNELIDLFASASTDKKSTARDLLKTLDPLNSEKYNDKLQ
jgi:hypothetical protein